jgi:putative ABC transport system permease protein
MFTAIRRLVSMQRQEIAVMRALGFARRQVRSHYLAFGLLTGGAGAALGALAAPVISLFVLSTQQAMFAVPKWRIAYTPLSAAVVALIVAACTASALLATAQPLRLSPADGLRQAVGRARRVSLERIGPLWRRLAAGTRWALRDALLHRVRFAMGLTAAIGCMMLLFAGFGVSDSMYDQVRQVFAVERSHGWRVSLGPDANTDDLTSGTQLLQETVVRMRGGGEDLNLTVVGPGKSLHLRSGDLDAPGDDGIYVTEALAGRLDLSPGVPLSLRFPALGRDINAPLTGVIDASTPQGFYVTSEYWQNQGNEFRPTAALTPGGAELGAHDRAQGTQVIQRTTQIDNGNRLVKGLESIFLLIRVFAIILAVVVLYSLGSLAFTERIRDYATLEVLGFSKRELRRLVGTENVIMTALGLAAGIPAGYWFLTVYVTMFDTRDTSYYAHITWVSVALAVAITAASALSTTAFLRRRIRSVNMVEALKGVE